MFFKFSSQTIQKIEIGLVAFFGLLLIVILPMLNAWAPAGHWFSVSDYQLNLWGKYLCYAIVALTIDFLWGYTGLLSLGQCLFFALGGYAFGMYLMLMIGELGAYKSSLPDFMVFLGYKELPAHWVPFENFWFAAIAVLVVPGLLALIFGFFAFRSRIKGVYFAILTQALTYAACLMFFRNDFTFGGNNGFTDFKFLLGFDLSDPATKRGLFIATAVYGVLVYSFLRWITTTKLGKVQQAIRDSENRVLFSGYNTVSYKLFVFTISCMLAGVAGALYVPQVGIINPGEMAPAKSLEAVVWVAVGGRGTLVGPIIGAISVNYMKSWASVEFAEYWSLMLGALFVIVVLLIPRGIVGLPQHVREWMMFFRRRADKFPDEEPAKPVIEAPAEPYETIFDHSHKPKADPNSSTNSDESPADASAKDSSAKPAHS